MSFWAPQYKRIVRYFITLSPVAGCLNIPISIYRLSTKHFHLILLYSWLSLHNIITSPNDNLFSYSLKFPVFYQFSFYLVFMQHIIAHLMTFLLSFKHFLNVKQVFCRFKLAPNGFQCLSNIFL